MAKKPDITTIASGYYSRTALNTNFENLRNKFDNTLSLDGSTPNAMGADLDMNSNDILNVQNIDVQGLRIDGVLIGSSDIAAAGANLYSDNYTGDGSTVAYSMSYNPFIKDNTQVYIDGVYQNKDGYSISGTTLTFSEAPPLNADIEIVVARSLDFSATDASNVGYTQGGTGSVTRTVQSRLRDFVSVKDFGAVGDGVTDDTAAIQAALDSGSKTVFFPEGNFFCGNLTISANTTLEGSNSLITYDGVSDYIFLVNGDDVSINGFDFNNINQECIRLGVQGNEIKNTVISKCRFTGFEDYGTILLYAWPMNVLVTECIFDKGSAWDGSTDSACVRMATLAGTTKTGTALTISNNFMRGYKNLFRGGTTGYMENLVIADNQMQDCGNGIWSYHVYNSTITGNTINNAAEYAYIWRSYVCSDNTWWDSTDSTAAVIIEALQGSFTGNKVFNTTGAGLLLDGGGSNGVIANNDFDTIGGTGIVVDPDHNFGGNVRNLLIANNRLYNVGQSGINVDATSTNLNGVTIIGNNVIAVGQDAPSVYACVRIKGDGNLSNIKVSGNYFVKNDQTTAGGTSQVEWGVKLVDASATLSACTITENFMSVPTTISRDGTGGSLFVSGNYVTESASLGTVNADLVSLNVDVSDTYILSTALAFKNSSLATLYRTTTSASDKVLSVRSDQSSTNTEKFQILGDGDVNNSTGVYGTISDQSVKQDITPARDGYLDEVKQLAFKNYRLIDDVVQNGDDAQRLFGLIAQDVEQIYPNLVETGVDGIKSIKTSVLFMIGLKALQELAAKVEALEAK